MMNLKALSLVLALLVGFALGAGCVRYAWQAERLETAQAQAAEVSALNSKLRKLDEVKNAAIDARDSALADLSRRDSDNTRLVERLRKSAAPAVPNDTLGSCQRHLAECRGLLAEGAGILAEGDAMVGRLDADRTAVRRLLK